MPAYTMQDALEAEQHAKDAEAYNRAAARYSNAARLAAVQAKRSLVTERGPEGNSP